MNISKSSRPSIVKPLIIQVSLKRLIWILISLTVAILSVIYSSYRAGTQSNPHYNQVNQYWQAKLLTQEKELKKAKDQADKHINALSKQLGNMQAHIIRLDALGTRLIKVTNLKGDEFNFGEKPAIGGPEIAELSSTTNSVTIEELFKQVDERINESSKQLSTLEQIIYNKKFKKETRLSGLPVKKGWVSSNFGHRIDPFSGNQAWHSGVDIAGKLGTPIYSVGAGIVTWSGRRDNYGLMVEVNHGNGYVSRYAHNTKNLVKLGEIVNKGDVLALMGTSGRSTGPHVHYEVLKNEKQVNPRPFINRI